ncbi:MAG: hypothetical protein AAB520_02415 [Patescibacteria group bacterium]
MKSTLLITILVLAVVGFFVFSIKGQNTKNSNTFTSPSLPAQEAVDIKATFAIFTNGTFRIFTDTKYHNISPDVFIASLNPNTVNVKKSDITWGDFFATLPMKLEQNCLTTGTGQVFCSNETQTLKFYINGQLDKDALNRIINNGDQLLVSYGDEKAEEIDKQLQQVPSLE